jgi:hypothetical protein
VLRLRVTAPLDLLDVALAAGRRLIPYGHCAGERTAKAMDKGHTVCFLVLATAKTDLAKTNGAKTEKVCLVLAAHKGILGV